MSRRARGCTVASEELGWTAEHRPGIASGPIVAVGDNRFRFFDALGPIRDDSVVADSIRLTRKGSIYSVLSKGTLPFGVSPSVRHLHRYGGTGVQCTSDWRFPRNTQIHDIFAVGCCELAVAPKRWRQISAENHSTTVGDWQSWPTTKTVLPETVMAVAMEAHDGTLLEVGLGEDLWRWRSLAGDGVTSGFCLLPGQKGEAIIQRVVAAAKLVEPPPRTWRFSWYATWQQPSLPSTTQEAGKKATWWSDGSLDTGYLKRAKVIHVDLSTMNLPSELTRSGQNTQPCLSAAGVQKRLKHAMRQINELTESSIPVTFTGWTPGPCCLGRHVDRKGDKRHWDWTAMLDFCAWSRNLFGPDRPLTFNNELPVVIGDPFLQLEETFDPMDDDEFYA